MEAQIKKGILEMCVLHLISQNELYCYDVMKHMRKYFPEVNESTFYSILRRLHGDGNADVRMQSGDGGPVRKYYRITENGKLILEESLETWRRIRGVVEELTQSGETTL